MQFESADQWRSWLEKNHATEKEAWVVLYRKKHEDQGLALAEAVEEALCFGWIDGRLNRLDEKRFLLRFSPRTPTSIWAISNIQRVEKLIKAGKMTEAGYQKIAEAQANGEWEAALRREQVDIIPKDLEHALSNTAGGFYPRTGHPLIQKRNNTYIGWSTRNEKQPDRKEYRGSLKKCSAFERRKPHPYRHVFQQATIRRTALQFRSPGSGAI